MILCNGPEDGRMNDRNWLPFNVLTSAIISCVDGYIIIIILCVYSYPSLSHYSHITADTDNNIFTFHGEVNSVIFVLVLYYNH